MTMKTIVLPDHYNYVAAFLTLRCNLNCPYCINRQGDFKVPKEMGTEDWIRGLSRIQTRNDLPITLQGGEPTIYPGFYDLAVELYRAGKTVDLLTNGTFELEHFTKRIHSQIFLREAPYASIRFSFHGQQGFDLVGLVSKIDYLNKRDYSVGIWGLNNHKDGQVRRLCENLGIDYRVKEYLDDKRGTYKYPRAVGSSFTKRVLCKPSELLIAPDGLIYRCHADLYAARGAIGHILDTDIKFPSFRHCDYFGHCNPCDIKLKTNRLQESGHCSVTIKEDI